MSNEWRLISAKRYPVESKKDGFTTRMYRLSKPCRRLMEDGRMHFENLAVVAHTNENIALYEILSLVDAYGSIDFIRDDVIESVFTEAMNTPGDWSKYFNGIDVSFERSEDGKHFYVKVVYSNATTNNNGNTIHQICISPVGAVLTSLCDEVMVEHSTGAETIELSCDIARCFEDRLNAKDSIVMYNKEKESIIKEIRELTDKRLELEKKLDDMLELAADSANELSSKFGIELD